MKKALSLLLVLAMVLSMVPAVFAEEAAVNTTFETIEAAIGAEVTYTFVPTENYRLYLEMTGDAAVTINDELVMDPVIEFPLPDNNEGAFDYVGGVTGEYMLEVWADTEYTIVVSGATNAATELYVADIVYPGEAEDYPYDLSNEWAWNDAWSEATATVNVAAGETFYLTSFGVGGMIMTINGGEGVTCEGNPRMPYTWSITNDGAEAADYVMVVSYPVGSMNNPYIVNVSKAAAVSNTFSYDPAAGETYFRAVFADAGWVIFATSTANGTLNVDGTNAAEVILQVDPQYPVDFNIGTTDWTKGDVAYTITYATDEVAAEYAAAQAVAEQINALYEYNWDTYEQELTGTVDEIKAAKAAYEALSETGKGYIDADTKTKLDNAVATLPTGPIPAADLVFNRYALSFQEYIGLQFIMMNNITANYDRVYAVVTMGDESVELDYTVVGPFAMFNKDVLSWSMAEDVTATLYATKGDETFIGATYTTSVMDQAIIKLGENAGKNDANCRLFVDMLNYGAAVQIEFDHNADVLPNATLAELGYDIYATVENPEITAVKSSTGTGSVTVSQESLSLQARVELQLIFRLNAASMAQYDAHVTVGGNTIIVDGATFTRPTPTAPLSILSTVFAPYNLREACTIVICDKEGNAVSPTYTYSVESLVNDKLNGTASDNVLYAMMKYGDSVKNIM